MKLFVIIATVVACACAAPTVELQHPSPVNPSVLVELKPEEKIILITDPKEIAKFKRETKQPLYPTVLPGEHVHHITKRDHKQGHDAKAPKTPKAPTVAQKPLQKPQAPNKPSLTKRNRRNVESHQKPEHVNLEEFQKSQLLPAALPADVISHETLESKNNRRDEITKTDNDNKETHQDKEDVKNVTTEVYQKPQGLPAIFSPSNKATQQQKRDIPVPLVAKHHHPEESPKETTTEKEVIEEKPKHESEVFQKPQGLPAIFSPSNDAPQPQKRDIPVPLVPKHHHPEESQKSIDEKETHEDKKEVSSEDHHEHQNLPSPIQDHVTVEGFVKPQTLPFIFQETPKDIQQHKRDIPVPLVPKHQHPEESPKEIDEKETHKHKNEVNSDHVTVEGFVKPQTLPFIFQETPKDTQQQKRDIPVPLVPKHQHPEESPKESNEKESHEDKKVDNTEDHHEHQTLQAHIQDDVSIPIFFKESPEDSQQNKRDIPVPLVSNHQHPEESPKESKEKESHEQKNEDNSENHHEPQTLSSHNQQHISIEEKPKTLPLILKDTPEDKRDIPVPLAAKHHHPEESQKENNGKVDQEDKKEVNTGNHHVCQTLPAHNHDHVTAEEIQKPQTLQLIVKETPEDTQQHKRDIPVPLVPKYHHPEESPKDSNENESHKAKNEENLENHQIPQTLQLKEPQFSTNIENVKRDDTQQQKRDTSVHKEESVKDNSNEKELHEQRKEENQHDPQIHHISQTLSTYNHEHLNIQGIHKPQVLPAFNHDHISQSSFDKSEISSNLQDHKNNEKVEGNIQLHHISQTLPGHIHKHLAMDGLQKPQILPGHNQEHTSFHKPQDLPNHHYEQFHSEGVQKPQTTPEVLKESNDYTHHQGPHLSGPIVGHHQEETLKESSENRNVKKSTEYNPNLHEVQVEDLSESKPYQQPIHHALPIQGDHKPNIREDHLSAPDFTTSTTDHPVLRHRPVPVAELFARAHDN
ncbi:titin-like [Calliphora vicina]|uniref:titin-like n=1 Tax=Calliphora vicina TaxID=7373 RepID=UPI00325A7847